MTDFAIAVSTRGVARGWQYQSNDDVKLKMDLSWICVAQLD